MFNKEADFENALIALLATKSWEMEVLRHPTEEDLIANWQAHLNKTNQHIDKLDVPLIRSEMNQILVASKAISEFSKSASLLNILFLRKGATTIFQTASIMGRNTALYQHRRQQPFFELV